MRKRSMERKIDIVRCCSEGQEVAAGDFEKHHSRGLMERRAPLESFEESMGREEESPANLGNVSEDCRCLRGKRAQLDGSRGVSLVSEVADSAHVFARRWQPRGRNCW